MITTLIAATLLAAKPVTILYPTSNTMYGGGVQTGTVADLQVQDGIGMRFNKCLGPTKYLSQVSCAGFTANYSGVPTSLAVTWVERSGTAGFYQTKLEMYNYTSSAWDAFAPTALTTSFVTRTATAVNAADYVDPLTGDVLARVDAYRVGPTPIFCTSDIIDQFYWTISP